METKTKLTIIILNYNTKELLQECLDSIRKYIDEVVLEVIVSDNASSDGSAGMVKKKFPWVYLIEGPNNGFSKGNNRARKLARGEMVLFLNPDTIVNKGVFKKIVEYLENHKDVGALGCKLVLPSGEIDKDGKRSFPTPWVSFTHLVLKLDRVFPKSKLFAKYWYGYLPENKLLEVDAIQGAFFLTRKKILDGVGWFDEDYFFYGEDLDLCWKIKKAGWKIVYYPKVFIYHLKGVSMGRSKLWKTKIPLKQKLEVKLATVEAMETFYKKNLWERYPLFFNLFVIFGIKLYKALRWSWAMVSSII